MRRIEQRLPAYLAALNRNSDPVKGQTLFIEHCASCHQVASLGTIAGPNLDSEFQRAPETIVRDILFPNETITEGFETVHLEMRQGADVQGLLGSESPNSITLRFAGGDEQTYLKKRIARIQTHKISQMPAQFVEVLVPEDVASIVEFLRRNKP